MSKLSLIFSSIVVMAIARPADAQAAPDPNCTYERCALGVMPVWDGLAVTRGDSPRAVGLLGFFWPGDVRDVFAGDDAAVDAATDAVRIRQVAALLTDGGLVLLATGVARGVFRRDWDSFSTVLTAAGGLALGVSIPVQFAADGQLSRAVWLFNRRYSK